VAKKDPGRVLSVTVPKLLAGLCDAERILYVESNDIAAQIEMENERERGSRRYFLKTANRDSAISSGRIRDIGYEPYMISYI
jgi:hypothetical protein